MFIQQPMHQTTIDDAIAQAKSSEELLVDKFEEQRAIINDSAQALVNEIRRMNDTIGLVLAQMKSIVEEVEKIAK
jgi:hypothetical protein